MPDGRLTDEFLDQAALYALEMLDAQEARAFESHLSSGCPACETEVAAMRETAALLAHAAAPRTPGPRVREELISRIAAPPPDPEIQVWRNWTATGETPIHVVRGPQGDWQTISDGVHVKQLYTDAAADTVTMLIRMERGSSYPAHRHAAAEQCFVLEGDLEANGIRLKAGDFQCARKDSVHGATTTEHGCLLLIVSSGHDQIIA